MKKLLLFVSLFALFSVTAFAADLDKGYSKNFGNGQIVAKNGDYPPLDSCNPADFDWKDGISKVTVSWDDAICLRAILPAGKRFKDFYQAVAKSQSGNLKYMQKGCFYYQLWSDHDESGNPIAKAASSWPKSANETPAWERRGWFTVDYDDESGEWDTVGINGDAFRENLMQYFSTAKVGQKFYVALSVGFQYQVGAGEPEQKWNSTLSRFETVISSGELGYAYSDPFCGGTIVVKENKTGN
ncbi:MAG: hypothetical protein KKB51_20715 [Candidatus Riflebacteria bacterium]|nr:hypothetical protein [Candidatus Riflebacteria bacterium]